MERLNPNIYIGLNNEQVNKRKKENLVNINNTVPTKSVKQIISSNFLTLFNLLNLSLAVTILLVKSYKNLLFMGVVICNTIISTIQELHSKRVVDKLSILSTSKSTVVRNGKDRKIDIDEIVLDDIIKYKLGNQVVVDSIIKEGTVEVDESFITGESNHIQKNKGDLLLSGSFIVSGNCICQVEHIGDDNYTNKISSEAKYIKKVNSVIMKTLNKIIKYVSIIIIPLGIVLFFRQYNLDGNNINDAVVNTVAAIIGMIPEGLVLLTSTVLAVSVIRLSKRNVLVQQLYCIETLARVDTICLDKTGTITEGSMEVKNVIPIVDCDYEKILSAISNELLDDNSTMEAIGTRFNKSVNWKCIEKMPFSSQKKYSGVVFKEGTFIIGAPDILVKDNSLNNLLEKYKDYRVLLLTYLKDSKFDESKINKLKPLALVLIQDKIRYKAKSTLDYFKKQGVDIKLISGDSIKTVSSIAKRVGIDNLNTIDLSTVDENDNIKEIAENYNLFCRVTPSQKKELILALKSNGHTVAMTGDGVNDVLALKEADCSIAMASGSDAARNVSELVILDSDFDSIPKVVEEGRRTVNNIERSATLFFTKTLYSTLLAILFLFVSMNYPFQPIQLSLTSALTIGIPSFVLALQPNKNKITGNFFINIISKSIPSALTIVCDVIFVMLLSLLLKLNPDEISTMSVILVAFTGFILLFKLCYPFNKLRIAMYVLLIITFIVMVIGLNSLFELVLLDIPSFIFLGILGFMNVCLFNLLTVLCDKKIFKYKDKIDK